VGLGFSFSDSFDISLKVGKNLAGAFEQTYFGADLSFKIGSSSPAPLASGPSYPTLGKTPYSLVTGQVVEFSSQNALENIPVEVLQVSTGQKSTVYTNKYGVYKIMLEQNKEYSYTIAKEGYLPYSEKQKIAQKSEDSFKKSLQLISINDAIKSQSILTLNNINFETGSYQLTSVSQEEIKSLAEFIKKSGIKIELSGHTDSEGNAYSNLTLSQKRAESLKNLLLKYGVNPKQMITYGHGDQKPVAPNDTEEGRQANRRVELKISGVLQGRKL